MSERKKKLKVDLPKLSVRTREPVRGECEGCEAVAVLRFRDADLGSICQHCAALMINVEMGLYFPKAKWRK